MSRMERSVLGVLLILIITLCLSFIVSKKTERLGGVDVTEDRLYTLTQGTREIIDGLREPLTMKLFYSKELVDRFGQDQLLEFNNYYFHVRDLLRSYERLSKGKLTLVEFDPRPFSDAEEEADRLKIQRFPVTEQDAFYFGLAVTSESGSRQTIAFFSPTEQSQIEYKLSEAVELATRRKKTKLGLLSSLDVSGGGMSPMMRQMMMMQGRQVSQPWGIAEDIGRFYEIQDVAADATEIPAELDYLMVVHPKSLSEKTLFAIDQFVMRGGKLLAFVDPYCYFGDRPPPNPQNQFAGMNHDASSNLNRLLETWGVTMEAEKFAGDLELAQRVSAGRTGAVRFVGSLAFSGAEAFSNDDAITQGLKGNVEMLFAGTLKQPASPPEGVQFAPLITTTAQGSTWSAAAYELGGPMGPDVQRLGQKFTPGSSKVVVAAKVAGKLKSAFPDGLPKESKQTTNGDEDEPKPEGPEAKTDGDHLKETKEPTAVVVVADVDMLTDNGAYNRVFGMISPRNSNADFVVNALEHLAGSTALMSIRSRPRFERPFDVVAEIEKRADIATREQVQRINDEIQNFEQELSSLRSQADDKNVGLLQSEAIEKQRAVEANIRQKRRELKDVQKQKLNEIESLGWWVKNINRIGVPLIVLAFGVGFTVLRNRQRRVHAAATQGSST